MWTRRSPTRSEAARRGLAVGLLAALAVLGASGCPFTPREAPLPCTPGVDPGCKTPVIWDPPLTADIAFENIRKALRKRGFDGPNVIPNYQLSLAENFLYVPDADAVQASAGRPCQPFFANWFKAREVQFMQDILEETAGGTAAAPDTVELTYRSRQENDTYPDPDLTRYTVEYVLSLVYRTPGTTDRRVECYGATALWDFSGVQRQDFRLFRWEDTAPLQDASCPGGSYGGSLGVLRALAGRCE